MNFSVIVSTLTAMLILGMDDARAVEVKLKYNHPTSGFSSVLSMHQPAGTYYLGLYNVSVDVHPFTGLADQSFSALCIDPFQAASNTWTSYEAVAFSTLSANTNYTNVRKLYDNAYTPIFSDNDARGGMSAADYSSAFHLALWEIWADNYNLLTNNVIVQGAVDNAVELKAQDFLNALDGWSVTNAYDPAQMVAFISPSKQDFLAIGVTSLPIPEADAHALLALGMGLVGLISRRRV